MNYTRFEPLLAEGAENVGFEQTLSRRQLVRLRRDQERGYSINSKQIVLAFAVEFTIVGLILTNIYVSVIEPANLPTSKVVQAFLFPIAMAMVELARVPLAVAVRTQNSWIVKFAALLGVLCAVAVTFSSLSTIGASSLAPRLEETNQTDDVIKEIQGERTRKQIEVDQLSQNLSDRQKERANLAQARQSLNEQLNRQPALPCVVTSTPSSVPGGPPTTSRTCPTNPAIKPLLAEIAAVKSKSDQLETAVSAAEAELRNKREELKPILEALAKAEAANRGSVVQSQLHSLAAMLFRIDPAKVTPEQLKTLESYLIFISSLGAAFSSTLIAMTAVRKIKPPKDLASVAIPDEAAAYLFGPLVEAIRKEAADAVAAATRHSAGPELQNKDG